MKSKSVNSSQSAVDRDKDKKCYVLLVSRVFPKVHPKSGSLTGFVPKIENGNKIHTIRENFDLWENRILAVNAGIAYISLRCWLGIPYNSKQVEVKRLYRVGLQSIELQQHNHNALGDKPISVSYSVKIDDSYSSHFSFDCIAKNDGLSVDDFVSWFFPTKHSANIKKGAIIHFTDFRY